ncbi:DEAD/DEAH box helicase [Planktosalinus lacus]|uniref:DEAD/DEAH box helicase n=1 Tax=Planktosalinus lacus TaxID=1526573 RepID=A0A8J2VAF4_9FLAO|nr:DEAD/DEAH box helicase [Planktosalinus lacus]GGD94053.1 DEAD/DEAH box helicase [Planktosalinus lacus]
MIEVKEQESLIDRELYTYQKNAIEAIFKRFKDFPESYNILYQLPTGGGKTVIFSEIAKRYINEAGKKVLILTHRIELSKQTSKTLTEIGVQNMIINSSVKEIPDEDDYQCYVAMVETLNNRLKEDQLSIHNIGLVIVDEAHYNSFRKLFKYFKKCDILGVTATPLSSNIKLPMKDTYNELIVGHSISELIEKGFLAKATTYNYNVGLGALRIGINGDYTVKSSEVVYIDYAMQEKLIYAYEERAKDKKTLIFNNGINTSRYVYESFKRAGYDNIRHLDNKHNDSERKEIIDWFRETPNAIITSVGILTTGFDVPDIEAIILNRATRSLTLYHQMIGRGSRITDTKKEFTVVDMGNNVARFGLWDEKVDWNSVFKNPDYFLENLIPDEEIERNFSYEMPKEIRQKFKHSKEVDFDVESAYEKAKNLGQKPKVALDQAIEQHAQMCLENSEDAYEAMKLALLLEDAISFRVQKYAYCLSKSTDNYRDWLTEDYKRSLRSILRKSM